MNVIKPIYDKVVARDPDQPEFHQAVLEVLESLEPVLEKHPEYTSIVERIGYPRMLNDVFNKTFVSDILPNSVNNS